MEQKKRRFAVLTGGGDCPGLNAVIRAVVKTFLQNDCEVYGVLNGFNGLINDNLKLMDYAAVSGILPRGGTILGTTNRDNPFHFAVEENGELVYKDMREKVIENLRKYDIEALVVIGGDGSLNIGAELARECDIKVVGVPKTIDNDLEGTDHTPGYGSAAKYIATVTKELVRDGLIYEMQSVTVIEIMGRNAGWLTGAAVLAKSEDCEGPDLIYLPEVAFDVDDFLKKVKKLVSEKQSIVIAVSEGIKTADGRYVCELSAPSDKTDSFGHVQLSGTGKYLSDLIIEKLGCKSRAIELSTLQRCAGHLTSRVDITEAYQVGGTAVKAAFEGKTGQMVILKRVSQDPYICTTDLYDVHKVANLEKKVPRSWITEEGDYVTAEMKNYIEPLIQAELTPIMITGQPRHIIIDDL